MNSPFQGQSEITIGATAPEIWAIIEEPLLIPWWGPLVKEVLVPGGQREHVGAVRDCKVKIGGRTGRVVERCIERIPYRKLSHVMERDTLGFDRMISDFHFSIILEPTGEESTAVRMESFYQPRGILGRVMNALMLRRQFNNVRRNLLANLKRFVEQGQAAHEGAPGYLGKKAAPLPMSA